MFFRLYRIVRSANYSLLVVLIAEYATLAVTTDRAGTSAHPWHPAMDVRHGL